MKGRERQKRTNGLARTKDGERIRVKIEELNDKGAGVAFYKKFKLTVPKTLPGEEVLLKYDPSRPRKDRIVLKKILHTAAERVQPPCEYFEECGACHLQHMSYEAQLQFKRGILQRALLAYPHLKKATVHPVSPMPQPFYYRNKTQMPFRQLGGDVVFGLYRKGTHWIIPVQQCMVESRDANRVLQIVQQWAREWHIPIYDEKTQQGLLRHVVVRKGVFTHQIMVVLVVREREVPNWKDLLEALKRGIPTLSSFYLNIQPEATNVILGAENILVWGEPFIEEKIGKIVFHIYPNTFFQVNPVQLVKMLEVLRRQIPFHSEARVLDLFSGVGTISLFFASMVKEVIGIDNNPDSIKAAVENARRNHIANVAFLEGDVAEKLEELQGQKFAVVVLDPPRKGVDETIVEKIAKFDPSYIAYISCNPTTLIRDLDAFAFAGYRTTEIFPFDMFPQTYHVESLAILEKSK